MGASKINSYYIFTIYHMNLFDASTADKFGKRLDFLRDKFVFSFCNILF